jgi:hypothetical protein
LFLIGAYKHLLDRHRDWCASHENATVTIRNESKVAVA